MIVTHNLPISELIQMGYNSLRLETITVEIELNWPIRSRSYLANQNKWRTWELGQRPSIPVSARSAGLVESTKNKLSDLNLVLRVGNILNNIHICGVNISFPQQLDDLFYFIPVPQGVDCSCDFYALI